MEKNEKKRTEQKNRVVEAMLRAREKEMQQGTPEEELPSLRVRGNTRICIRKFSAD